MVLKGQFTIIWSAWITWKHCGIKHTNPTPANSQEERHWEVNAGDTFNTSSTFSALTDQLNTEGKVTKEPQFPLTADIQGFTQTSADLKRAKPFPIKSPHPFISNVWLCPSSPSPAWAVQDPLSCGTCQPLITQHWKSKNSHAKVRLPAGNFNLTNQQTPFLYPLGNSQMEFG